MLFIMATILMIQLQSFHRLFLVFAVAPLWVCRSPPDERVQQYRQVVEGHARGRHQHEPDGRDHIPAVKDTWVASCASWIRI
jgi:hypothetical protein